MTTLGAGRAEQKVEVLVDSCKKMQGGNVGFRLLRFRLLPGFVQPLRQSHATLLHPASFLSNSSLS